MTAPSPVGADTAVSVTGQLVVDYSYHRAADPFPEDRRSAQRAKTSVAGDRVAWNETSSKPALVSQAW
jgi:hypothetical protein